MQVMDGGIKLVPDCVLRLLSQERPTTYPTSQIEHGVVVFADISGFTTLCEQAGSAGNSGIDILAQQINQRFNILVEGKVERARSSQ
eukprot:m.41594 g.41594  ORF g.41594 m.41594 type:complete len:87 (-) comp10587_c1_seq2:96-356(-)